MIPGVEVRPLRPYRDERGGLVKVLMRQHVPEHARLFGEIYISWAEPGAVKANHYHRQTTEWFYLLRGEADLVLEDPRDGRRMVVHLHEAKPQVVTVPPGIAHALVNRGDAPAHLLAYADRPYDPKDPDTVPYVVVAP